MFESKNRALSELLERNLWPEEDTTTLHCQRSAPVEKLGERIDKIPLYAHTYPFLFSLRSGRMTPMDLIDYAYTNELSGCALHVHDGGPNSLARMSLKNREAFGRQAEELKIRLSVETSHTDVPHIDEAVSIARDIGTSTIRVYSRYKGRISEILPQIKKDFEYMATLAEKKNLYFNFEQHEELKSHEIVSLLEDNGSSRLGILFDFGNMLNAYETPLRAINTMAPYIRQVHVKGARRVADRGGWGQQGVLFKSAEDEIPAERLLYELLLLGKPGPQVTAFMLEQEVGFFAPSFRNPNEGDDPYIPHREPSETHRPAGMKLHHVCLEEKRYATDMIGKVRKLLFEMKCAVNEDSVLLTA